MLFIIHVFKESPLRNAFQKFPSNERKNNIKTLKNIKI